MILTDREIAIAIDSRQIVIDAPTAAEAFSSTSVDLTLAEGGRVWKTKGEFAIRPSHQPCRMRSGRHEDDSLS
jgi:deoxycytidine triphosphate deaminase